MRLLLETVATTLVLVLGAVALPAVDLPDVESLEGDPVVTLLPPDAIPSIDNPGFVPAGKADRFLRDDEPVIGVVHEGQAKAYSLWHLDRHEVVNDRFGEDPVAVTW